ncbi:MAG: hypothetical protein ABGX49_00470, partial [Candidatus Poseidoniia archaeon]
MQARSLALILAALMTIGSLAGCVEPESEGHTHEEGDHDHDEGEDPVDDGTEDGGEGEHSDEGEHDDEGETEDDNHGEHETEPESAPWFCNSSGMGGHHMDPAYTGMMKGQLSDDDCAIVSIQFAAAA